MSLPVVSLQEERTTSNSKRIVRWLVLEQVKALFTYKTRLLFPYRQLYQYLFTNFFHNTFCRLVVCMYVCMYTVPLQQNGKARA